MDIRRLGARSLANLTYAYLLTNYIEEQIGQAERRAVERKADLSADDRRAIVETAVNDFNRDLETVISTEQGIDPARITRARDNTRALGALISDLDRANTAPAG